MAVIATDQCTLSVAVDVESVETWYMQVAASANAPAKPTVANPSSLGWTTTEPGFDAQNSKKLYTCQKTTLTDGTFMWGAVQLSSSYTGASTALNTANAAATAASNAEKVATNYITALSGNGIWVTPDDAKPSAQGAATSTTSGWHISDAIELFRLGVSHIKMWVENSVAKLRLGAANSTHVLIDSDSLDIEDGSSNVLATFGASGAQIGLTDESHMGLDYHSMQMVDSDDVTYMHVSDLRDRTGYATITEVLPFNDPYIELSFTTEHSLVESITLDDGTYVVTSFSTTTMEYDPEYGSMLPWDITRITVVSYEYAIDPGDDMTPAVDPSTATVTYKTNDTRTKTFTLGTRKSGTVTGPYSYALGSEVEASGTASHAEGINTKATGVASHAEGFDTLASEYLSHAEGGSCQAIGPYSHAEGAGTVAVEAYSHAEGSGTIANDLAQTAIGRYNVRTSSRAFVIGNGTGDGNRSNALTVDWSGNVVAAGGITFSGGTLGSAATHAHGDYAAAGDYWSASKGGTSYWGLVNPDGASTGWVRTPASGLLPAASGGGSSSLGTSGWPFTNLYATNIYHNGTKLGTIATHAAGDYALAGHTHSYLPLSGGTLTGNVTMDHKYIYLDASDVDIANPPTSGVAGNARIQLRDKNDNIVAQLIPYISNAGRYGAQFGTAGNWLYITTDGTNPYVAMTNAAAWRTGLGLGSIATAGAATYLKRQPASGELASTTNTGVFPIVLSDSFANSGVVSYMSQANFRTALDLQQQDDYYAASSATQVNVANTSLYRFLVILFRTNSATYTGGGTSAATSPLNSTVVHINKKSSGSVYVSLMGAHALSGTSVQIRTGLATITCSATAGKVVLSNQRYINLGNGSSGTQEVGTQTDMALVGVVGIY